MPIELGACFAAVDQPLAAELGAYHRHLRVAPRKQLDDDVGHPAPGHLGGLVGKFLAKDAGDVSIPEKSPRSEETLPCGGRTGHREDVQSATSRTSTTFHPMFGMAGIAQASRRRITSTVPGLAAPNIGPCMK